MDPFTWAILGTAALGAYMQNRNAQAKQEAEKQQMLANATQIEYSPWTHAAVNMQGPSGIDPTGAAVGGALQGGLTGAMMGSQFRNLNTPPSQPVPTQPVANQAMNLDAQQKVAADASQSPAFNMDMQSGYGNGNPWMQMQKPNLYSRQPN